MGAETDRWRKLAVVLPVIATIASAGITATAAHWPIWHPAPASAPDVATIDAHKPLPKNDKTPAPRPIQSSDNLSEGKALEVPLDQPARGDTQERRWFKFNVAQNDAVQIRIGVRNMYQAGNLYYRVFNSGRTKIIEGSCGVGECTIQYASPQSDTYYLHITEYIAVETYELTIMVL